MRTKIFAFVFALITFFIGTAAYAATPTFSLSAASDGSVTVTANGDANSSVLFLYTASDGTGSQIKYLGTTNSGGYFSTTIAPNTYAIGSTNPVSVTINGQQSTPQGWPASSNSPISLSQTSITLYPGQQSTITAYNTSAAYVSSNSNATAASVSSTNGNQLTVTANAIGTSVINICPQGSSGGCASVTVTVVSNTTSSAGVTFNQSNVTLVPGQTITILVYGNGSYTLQTNSNTNVAKVVLTGSSAIITANDIGSSNVTVCQSGGQCGTFYIIVNSATPTVTFNPSTISLASGQTQTVSISGNGGYSISSNSSPSIASASISGGSIIIYANNAGTDSITICESDGQCGILPITITGQTTTNTTTTNTAGTTFSTSNLALTIGQTQNVQVYGSGNYMISNNSNSSVASVILSGSTIAVTANNTGSAAVTVCQNGIQCGTFFITVTANTNGVNVSSSIGLAQGSLSLNIGQNQSIPIYGNSTYAISSNSNPSVALASVSGTSLVVSAINYGTTAIALCTTDGTNTCTNLSVTVSSTAVPSIAFSPTTANLTPGQSQTVQIYGNGNYSLSNSSNPSVASTIMSGNSMIVVANAVGNTVLTICQGGSLCGTFNVTVATPPPSTASVSVVSAPATTAVSNPVSTNYVFTLALGLGSTGTEVTQLQDKLASLGYYTGSATGYYGSLTTAAVKAFQAAKGITQLGTVGPQTRNALNGNSTAIVSTTTSSHIFTEPLSLGSKGSEVTALQEKLTSLGYYSGPTNGSYGPLTEAAVKAFQAAVGLQQLGNVGPGTRAALNSR